MDARTISDDDVVYYLAASIDGFIAGKDGDVAWLSPYFIPELGFHAYMDRIASVLMGRTTWDRMLSLTGGKSAYGEKPTTVVTNRALNFGNTAVATASGSPAEIVAAMRERADGPIWLVGGADLATQFLDAGILTRIDLFTVPVLLGQGIPAFRNQGLVVLDLLETGTYPKGITRTTWRPRAA